MNKTYTIAALAASLSMMAVSCQIEKVDFPDSESASSALSISPAISDVLTSEPLTKGELINWDQKDHADIDFPTDKTFFVTAVDGEGEFIPAWTEVKYLAEELGNTGLPRNMWKPTDGSGKIIEYDWKPNDTKTFYAYAFLPEGSGSDITGTSEGMSMHYCVPEDIAAQQDLLFASYKGIGDGEVVGKTDGTASLLFHHALTSVVIQLGTVKGAATFEITGIALEGVYASGTGVLTPDSAMEEEPADRVEWTADESGGKPVTTTFAQSIATTPVPTEADPTPEIGEPFIIIPQTFGPDSKARLKVSIEIDGRAVDIYYPLKGTEDENLIWGAGMVNVYTVDYNGHEGVQLWPNGPYWATKNVGAESPEDCGWYFSWGNVQAYACRNIAKNPTQEGGKQYECDFYPVTNGVVGTTKKAYAFAPDAYYENPGKNLYNNNSVSAIPVNPANDAAQAIMGIKWRIPTIEEFTQLKENTNMLYTSRNGVAGFLFTGKAEGYTHRSIFIPVSGYAQGGIANTGYITRHTSAAYLWSSTKNNSKNPKSYSMQLGHNAAASGSAQDNTSFIGLNNDQPYGGRVIRAVENTDYDESAGK